MNSCPFIFSTRAVSRRNRTYRALNPQMLVPTLETGDLKVGQSLAILEWLEETHPEPPLLPDSADERARVRAFALAIACDIHPFQNLRVLQYLRDELAQDEEGVGRWLQRWLGDGLAACEELLAGRERQTTFCFGETPGLADICLIPQIFSARRFNIDLSSMPRILAIDEACGALPAFADAHPSRQPDAG
jgi:maleylpyruvate isomerase